MRSTERLTAEHGALLVVDVQEKLVPKIHRRDLMIANAVRLVRGARALGLPVWGTEQYPEGLGPTVAPLAELRRVLRSGGRLVLSVNHPILYKMVNPQADYFALTEWTDEYTFGDQPAVLTYWHRPLRAMTDAFANAGFQMAVVSEPPWSPDTPAELLPPGFEGRTSFLSFIFFVLVAEGRTDGPPQ